MSATKDTDTTPAQEEQPNPETVASLEAAAKSGKAAAAFQELSTAEHEARRLAHHEATLKKQIERGKFRQLAENGNTGWFDQDIAYFLEGIHTGKINRPTFPDPPTDAAIIAYRVLKAVADNDPGTIKRLADAVVRVHERASGEGESFKICPADPKRAKVLEQVRKEGVPGTPKETGKLLKAAGIKNEDPSEIRRIHKALGGRVGTVGRPPKG